MPYGQLYPQVMASYQHNNNILNSVERRIHTVVGDYRKDSRRRPFGSSHGNYTSVNVDMDHVIYQ